MIAASKSSIANFTVQDTRGKLLKLRRWRAISLPCMAKNILSAGLEAALVAKPRR